MRILLSVRWRLRLAFLGISAFAVLAAAVGTYAFRQTAFVLERITEQRVPSALAALDLSRQAARIVAAAPTLLSARSQAQYREVSTAITTEVDRLQSLLAQIKRGAVDPGALAAMEPAVEGLHRNLAALATIVERRLELSDGKNALLRRLSNTTVAAQRLVAPAIVVMDSKIAALRRATSGDPTAQPPREFAQEIASNLPMQKAQLEFAAINDGLLKAAAAENPADLTVLAFPLNRSLSTLREIAAEQADPRLRSRLDQRLTELANLTDGPDSILQARRAELGLVEQAERLQVENGGLSSQLTTAVDSLVAAAGRDIREAGEDALATQRMGRGVLLGVVVMSLISSLLIVWLYVDRNIVARLQALSSSMLAIAGGNLRAPLPPHSADEIGRMAKALSVFRDTAIEIEEKNLREIASTRQHLIDAIESISEGFALYDQDDCLVLCNSRYAELLYPETDVAMVPGSRFETVIRRAAELDLIQEARGRTDAWVRERMERHRNPIGPEIQHRGGDRWIQVSERRIAGAFTVAVYTDITELKRHAAQLELTRDQAMEATRAKSQFLANMSHELRTPMNAVLGFTEMMADGLYGQLPDKALSTLERVQANGKHLLGLINDVLDLAKIEAGQLTLRVQDYTLVQVVQTVVSGTESLARAKGITLTANVQEGLPRGHGDDRRLTQVLLNLVGNSIKFTDHGSVQIVARAADGLFDVAVHDTGPGISLDDQARIFQEFQQVDSSSTRRKGGTGLGLAISKRLIEMHGGTLTVESALGEGSTFRVLIPIRVEERTEAA
jgi:adenylate cyclase